MALNQFMQEASNNGVQQYEAYQRSAAERGLTLPEYRHFKQEAIRAFTASPFVAKFAIKEPVLFNQLFHSGDIDATNDDYFAGIAYKLQNLLTNELSEPERDKQLRLFRQYETVRIVWQQTNGLGDFERHASDLSYLAESIIRLTLKDCHYRVIQQRGIVDPLPELLVIGMGKLGGRELNFSSDIDLVFIHDTSGEVANKRGKVYEKQMLYTQIGQKLINALHKLTLDGFVYRVDMRLRPFGEGSPLSCSMKAFEHYTLKHAREWERYAFVKGRVITGNFQHKSALAHIIKSFVYRKYFDYKMPASIRSMKQMIMKEMAKKQLQDHIKLGRGGIREIEFLVQCYQLMYGGQIRDLRSRTFKKPLFTLQSNGYLSATDTEKLYQCYLFLRNVENALQMQCDEQKHCKPKYELEQHRLCLLLHYPDWETLNQHIEQSRDSVVEIFDRMTHFDRLAKGNNPIEHQPQQADQDHQKDSTEPTQTDNEALDRISQQFIEQLQKKKRISQESKNLILSLLPLIVWSITQLKQHNMVQAFEYTQQFLMKIAKRPTYLYLLDDHKEKINRFITLFCRVTWFRNHLLEYPSLLEYTLQRNDEPQVLSPAYFQQTLQFNIKSEHADDKENQIEILSRFKLKHTYIIALLTLNKRLSILEASDALTYLAEAICNVVLQQAWSDIIHKTPSLKHRNTQELKEAMAIIGYGKLGGYELSITSDLDLIFLYQQTDNEHDARIFARVAQQFISLMRIPAYSGALYEIDVRLRPEGSSGLLVSSIQAYEDYQLNKAWTWEHQSLVRARYICGSRTLESQFNRIRTIVLTRCYLNQQHQLAKDIVSMRMKMQQSLLKVQKGQFDLKQSNGGMVDIEFFCQFMVLKLADSNPQLCDHTDNITILKQLTALGFLDSKDSDILVEAYCYYRHLHTQAIFGGKHYIVNESEVSHYPQAVIDIWHKSITNDCL